MTLAPLSRTSAPDGIVLQNMWVLCDIFLSRYSCKVGICDALLCSQDTLLRGRHSCRQIQA